MSNLSELLPAGAGAKSAEFVASGTLGSGVTVALKADGTVEAVGESTVAENVGTASQIASSSSTWNGGISAAFDVASGTHVIFYKDTGDSGKGKAVVATPSGSSLSFGTPVVVDSNGIIDPDIVYANSLEKVLVSHGAGTNNRGKVYVGTVSGTSISFGSAYAYADFAEQDGKIAWSTDDNVFVVVWDDDNNYGESRVGSVSGTTISYGTEVAFETSGGNSLGVSEIGIGYTTGSKVVVAYRDPASGTGQKDSYARVGTISGTSISWGARTLIKAGTNGSIWGTKYHNVSYDPVADKVIISYWNESNSDYPEVIVGTISGTTISFGTSVVVNSAGTQDSPEIVYNTAAAKTVIYYTQNSGAGSSTAYTKLITISGTTPSLSSQLVTVSGDDARYSNGALSYDSTNKNVLLAYPNSNSPYGGKALIYTAAYIGTNNTSFIGITDQAIADTATGAVIVQGGVAGSVAYNSGPGAITDWTTADYTNTQQAMTYDANAQKLVIFYSSGVNTNHGYYVVGTVSGTSLSFGTPGLVSAVAISWQDIIYDANSQKVVAVYNNAADADHGYAVVGTVSGTSISWGTPVKFEAGGVYYTSAVYDPNSQKVVISYYDSGNSNYGTSIVGTVSGTSISFGTAVVFESANAQWISSIFDSTNNKIIIGYRDNGNSNYGTAIVGTVSGTSISFGSPTVFEAAPTDIISLAYDANANKVVVAYRDTDNSNAGTSVVGTVSGTSISFGSPVVFQASGMANQLNDITAQYDPSTQTVLIGFRDSGDSNYGKTVVGTVSGTSISFTTPTTFNENTTLGIVMAYASNQQKMVIAFDQEGTTPDTKAFVYTPDTTLTPNTDYYVQADGTLSTTVSSVPAGRALSTTSILLEG